MFAVFNLPINQATTIELVPEPYSADVTGRLTQTLYEAEGLRASVAYWTIDSLYLGSGLAPRIAQPRGFVCVDIHLPTNIDRLNALVAKGGDVRLHLKKISGNTETCPAPDMPPYLLHTKLLLFDLPGDEAELWVGSHNWTQRALEGPNLEASLVLRIKKDSPLYRQASEMLEYIHDLCTPFDPTAVEYYKQLQQSLRDDPPVRVIECEGKQIQHLENTGIAVFSDFADDIGDLPIGSPVYLLALDTDQPTAPGVLYSTRTIQTGALPAANLSAAEVRFQGHRYIQRRERRLPVLEPTLDNVRLVADMEYFAMLDIKAKLPNAVLSDPLPKKSFWQTVSQDALLTRTRHNDRLLEDITERSVERDRRLARLRIKVPAITQMQTREPDTLFQKRLLEDRKLVLRKILRSEGIDD